MEKDNLSVVSSSLFDEPINDVKNSSLSYLPPVNKELFLSTGDYTTPYKFNFTRSPKYLFAKGAKKTFLEECMKKSKNLPGPHYHYSSSSWIGKGSKFKIEKKISLLEKEALEKKNIPSPNFYKVMMNYSSNKNSFRLFLLVKEKSIVYLQIMNI